MTIGCSHFIPSSFFLFFFYAFNRMCANGVQQLPLVRLVLHTTLRCAVSSRYWLKLPATTIKVSQKRWKMTSYQVLHVTNHQNRVQRCPPCSLHLASGDGAHESPTFSPLRSRHDWDERDYLCSVFFFFMWCALKSSCVVLTGFINYIFCPHRTQSPVMSCFVTLQWLLLLSKRC